MSDTMSAIAQEILAMNWLELIAVIASLAYVLLAGKSNIWCWPAAIIASGIYCYIFLDINLFMDSALQVYYIAMAVYGWAQWRQIKLGLDDSDDSMVQTSASEEVAPVQSWPLALHLKMISALSLASLILGYVMENYTQADFAYLDTFTTVFSVYATYLIAIRLLETWLYWIAIDIAGIYIYSEKSLNLTMLLFAGYTLLAAWAYWQWRTLYLQQQVGYRQQPTS
ncbi:nicotinamide mononucleotide transporter PnuC [Catenovulum agarivorans DS-2]|uniref:Nicotinamide riboside transporter PnuC n=1 Tax=Catenovulum agarivorans DS-2 TaxID=1328313 RepID=W7QRQ1_9ALTE|nr:nicotinamide riboside transporter PnuC [Catenovulum agarivorans]EWH11687.1 nicotinamide mononucleotide transporter PnuC [Catenovulum agarivorans DS-2]